MNPDKFITRRRRMLDKSALTHPKFSTEKKEEKEPCCTLACEIFLGHTQAQKKGRVPKCVFVWKEQTTNKTPHAHKHKHKKQRNDWQTTHTQQQQEREKKKAFKFWQATTQSGCCQVELEFRDSFSISLMEWGGGWCWVPSSWGSGICICCFFAKGRLTLLCQQGIELIEIFWNFFVTKILTSAEKFIFSAFFWRIFTKNLFALVEKLDFSSTRHMYPTLQVLLSKIIAILWVNFSELIFKG